MAQDANQIAALANQALYDRDRTVECSESFPHIRHPRLQDLFAKLIAQVFSSATQFTNTPKILDLGAGEGSATLPFLELGAYVTAVDISQRQLASLRNRCRRFAERLEVRNQEISEALRQKEATYDVVVMNACLHHIPDYIAVIEEVIPVLRSGGLFFSFQDPLRYDGLGIGTMVFAQLAYFGWRIFQGNYIEGLKTRIRRMRGIYVCGSEADDAEYHVTRNGVDQDAIVDLFKSRALTCEVIRYFSTQSRLFQFIGAYLGTENTFAIIAQKTNSAGTN